MVDHRYRFVVDENKCIGCSTCVETCPNEVLESKDGKPEAVRQDALVEELDDVEDEVVDVVSGRGRSVNVKTVLLAEDDVVVLDELGRGDEEEDVGEKPVIDRAQVFADFPVLESEKGGLEGEENVVRVERGEPLLELFAQKSLVGHDFRLKRCLRLDFFKEGSVGFEFIADDKQAFLHSRHPPPAK